LWTWFDKYGLLLVKTVTTFKVHQEAAHGKQNTAIG
jgi:hypothetical protein